jgi:signal transduction histidine kinase
MHTTAAWRISIWTSLAFAIGTGLAFAIVCLLVAQSIRERSDAWLSGEAGTLARVSTHTPKDRLSHRIVGEVAELAFREVPDERNSTGQKLTSVFFVEEQFGDPPATLWIGPGSSDAFLKAIHQAKLVDGRPESIKVEGWSTSFRVVSGVDGQGKTLYLGLSNRGDIHLLRLLILRFLLLWGATVLLGFLVSYLSARRTLIRVEHITETVARIGSEDLSERLPESAYRDEIARLAKTFNRMLDRIQSSVRELRLVTDAVAHDMKSPVTSVRGALESALSKESNEKWRDSICEAIDGLDRLLNLLNSTLDVAEAQAGALSLDRSTVDLSALVRQLVNLYQPAMAERNHELTADVEGHVVVDADGPLLHRVVNNLLENELAHLPTGCQITIRLRSRSGSAELTIEDNGPGFPPEVTSRAFERFVKGKHSSGYGLGLAFVSAVINAHGGVARISNHAGGGAAVSLSLPAKVLQPV